MSRTPRRLVMVDMKKCMICHNNADCLLFAFGYYYGWIYCKECEGEVQKRIKEYFTESGNIPLYFMINQKLHIKDAKMNDQEVMIYPFHDAELFYDKECKEYMINLEYYVNDDYRVERVSLKNLFQNNPSLYEMIKKDNLLHSNKFTLSFKDLSDSAKKYMDLISLESVCL